MRFDELYKFLSENTLNKYNLFKCYSSVYDINDALWKIGLEEFMFPTTEHLDFAFNCEPKLGEQGFELVQKSISEPHYDHIEVEWFQHCKLIKTFSEEVNP